MVRQRKLSSERKNLIDQLLTTHNLKDIEGVQSTKVRQEEPSPVARYKINVESNIGTDLTIIV